MSRLRWRVAKRLGHPSTVSRVTKPYRDRLTTLTLALSTQPGGEPKLAVLLRFIMLSPAERPTPSETPGGGADDDNQNQHDGQYAD